MQHRHFHSSSRPGPRRTLLLLAVLLFTVVAYFALRKPTVEGPATMPATTGSAANAILIPDFKVPVGRVRPPLEFRIVSFHRGRADKNLIKLAAQLGFNGVQFQIEGSTEKGVAEFAERDKREELVAYCHSLGMQVTLWVHELSDLPASWSSKYLGAPAASNEKLFAMLDSRYERMLTQTVPQVDGLVLTVVETQVRATDTELMLRLTKLIAGKCRQHGKSFMVRTFVWTPEEFADVMAAVNRLPPDMVVMSKVVPQDWQMRGADAKEIGAVGGRKQVVEYDACGEYFFKSTVANCMVELLKKQFDYGISKGVSGICVRVDRDDTSVLYQPNEVNLWALGLLASGVTDSAEDVWTMWSSYRYGTAAGPRVVAALKGSSEVVTESLSVGPFTFGDTRKAPALPDDEDIFWMNWQNWRWDRSYMPAFEKAERGDAVMIGEVALQKAAAMKKAEECLQKLEAARGKLAPVEYMILYTKLLTNKERLASFGAMEMATLEYRAMEHAATDAEKKKWAAAMAVEIERVRAVAKGLEKPAIEVDYLGKHWRLGVAEISAVQLDEWLEGAERVARGEDAGGE